MYNDCVSCYNVKLFLSRMSDVLKGLSCFPQVRFLNLLEKVLESPEKVLEFYFQLKAETPIVNNSQYLITPVSCYFCSSLCNNKLSTLNK